MVEPLLRFLLVARGHALLHCAAVDAERGAIVMSAQTDTGKTSTVLRLLMRRNWGFLSDDMAIVDPDGTIRSFPKPMTLSSHTMNAVNDRKLPFADRFMLGLRSRVHSKKGRSIGHALGRGNVPIVTINAAVQLLVPPPKYHVTSLVDCEMSDAAPIDSVILMERGEPLREEVGVPGTLDVLIENTDDAYTFPPFASFAPEIVVDGLDYPTLRKRERAILESAIAKAWRVRLRVSGHGWSDLIPNIVAEHTLLAVADDEPVHDEGAEGGRRLRRRRDGPGRTGGRRRPHRLGEGSRWSSSGATPRSSPTRSGPPSPGSRRRSAGRPSSSTTACRNMPIGRSS